MKNLLPLKISRIIYAVIAAVFGLFHFMAAKDMAGIVPSFVPGGVFWVYFTGACLIAAAVAIISNWQRTLAANLLGILFMIFALTVWLPQLSPENQFAMPNLLKDMSMAMAAFMVAATTEK